MAEWRLFTRSDWHDCGLSRAATTPCWSGELQTPRLACVLATPDEFQQARQTLQYRLVEANDRVRFERGKDEGPESKLPRAHIWRTYRYTDNGALLAAVSLKSSEAFHCTEIDAFLAADVPERPPFSALSAALLFAITDAVKTGSSLALQFTKRFTKGVPLAVRKLAAANGIALEHADRGAIAPAESRALYVALTAFTAAARARLRSLTEREQLSPVRVCYLVHHGVWALDEVDALLVGASHPTLVLGAVPPAEQRILSQVALLHARAVLLAGMLRRALACQETDSDLCAQPMPPDVSQVAMTAMENFRIVFQANRALELHGWLAGKPAAPWRLPAGQQLSALLRPWRAADAALRWQDDVRIAAQPRPSSQAAIVVTADFLGLAATKLDRCLSQASQAGVAVLVCPERIVFLDDETRRRWELGRHVRT